MVRQMYGRSSTVCSPHLPARDGCIDRSQEVDVKLTIKRIVVAAGLLAVGWTAGQAAQAPQADFDLQISSPAGTTTVTCTRGCGLQFIRMAPDKSKAEQSFTYTCGDAATGRCGGSVQGWVTQ
jgi:hypothetical protein